MTPWGVIYLFLPKKGRIIAVRINIPKDTNPNKFLKSKIFLLSLKTEQESISITTKIIKNEREVIVEIFKNLLIYLVFKITKLKAP
jgi:hypothetical protein